MTHATHTSFRFHLFFFFSVELKNKSKPVPAVLWQSQSLDKSGVLDSQKILEVFDNHLFCTQGAGGAEVDPIN